MSSTLDDLIYDPEGECVVILDNYLGSSILTSFYRSIAKINSKLINDDQFLQLFKGKEIHVFKPPQLLYRASRDGFSSESFHKCCDDQFKVVIIVKSKDGDLFGGYTTKNLRLDGEAENVADDDLFTFRFEKKKFYTFRLLPGLKDHVLYRYGLDETYLFAFGYCFWVCPDANERMGSGSHQTEHYVLPECKLPNNKRYFGGNIFLVEDLEVFKVTD